MNEHITLPENNGVPSQFVDSGQVFTGIVHPPAWAWTTSPKRFQGQDWRGGSFLKDDTLGGGVYFSVTNPSPLEQFNTAIEDLQKQIYEVTHVLDKVIEENKVLRDRVFEPRRNWEDENTCSCERCGTCDACFGCRCFDLKCIEEEDSDVDSM